MLKSSCFFLSTSTHTWRSICAIQTHESRNHLKFDTPFKAAHLTNAAEWCWVACWKKTSIPSFDFALPSQNRTQTFILCILLWSNEKKKKKLNLDKKWTTELWQFRRGVITNKSSFPPNFRPRKEYVLWQGGSEGPGTYHVCYGLLFFHSFIKIQFRIHRYANEATTEATPGLFFTLHASSRLRRMCVYACVR